MTSVAPLLTAELFVIPSEGAFLVYAPLRQVAFVANARVVNLIAGLKEGTLGEPDEELSELVAFLQQLRIVDGGAEQAPSVRHEGNPRPTEVTLFLTTGCNLRCTYCYASAGDTPLRTMPFDVARRGIDFIVANAVESQEPGIEVAYHGGGEPTLNWDTLTKSFDYAAERAAAHGLRLKTGLATNAVLSDEKIDWIVSHLGGASVSLDGLPEVNDRHRLTISGKGSSAAVARTLRRFDEAEFSYGLRLTVTAEHIASLPESIDHVCRSFHPTRIQVEPSYQLGRWREAPSAETEQFISAFRAARRVASRYGHDLFFSGARLGELTNHFCSVTQDSFCLTADGGVSSCYEVFLESSRWADTFLYGRSRDEGGFVFNLPVLDNLRAQTVDNRDYCSGCFAKWTCGGDCFHKALDATGDSEFRGTDRCHIIQELTKDQILQRIADSGGLFWNGD